MEDTKIIECPQIRYHITYDNNLTLKDLEDLLKLIRISNNDVLGEIKIPRSEGNNLQKIEAIYPGSIILVTVLKKILSIGINCFAERIIDKIYDRIEKTVTSCENHPTSDKPVYCKYRVELKIGEQAISVENNSPHLSINIKVHNGNKD